MANVYQGADAVGGLGASGGQKESQKNRFGAAEPSPTVTSLRPAVTHNRRTIAPYSMPLPALIIPWSCVQITPGLVVCDGVLEWQGGASDIDLPP